LVFFPGKIVRFDVYGREKMSPTTLIDQTAFRRILSRNIKLPLAVGVLSAAIFVALIFYLLSVIGWVEHTERVIGNTNETAKLALDRQAAMRGFLLTGDENYLVPFNTSRPLIVDEINVLAGLVADNPPQVERFKRILAAQNQWDEYAQRLIALRNSHGDYIGAMRTARGNQGFEDMRKEFADALAEEQGLLQDRNDKARTVTAWTVGSFLLFSLMISGLLSYFGRRDLMNLSNTYQDALSRQIQQAELVQQQGWLRSGHAQLGEQMVGQTAAPQLAEKTLEFLARYLDAAVAAFYLREDNGSLTRIASYGFSRPGETENQSFYAAEGLLGQAAKQRRVLVLNDIPNDYLKVTTGLGQGKPRNVTLAPVDNDGSVNGVIEMGFLREVTARDVEFMELIANSIGTSVEAARYRQRLQDMLEETQQLNEEMTQQQEELRASNEELEQQSRVLEQSQTLLEERASDLQEASRYKSEFLANMSHELRTPLNSALILAKLLSDNQTGNLNGEQVKFAETIYSAGNDLLNLINDILDISKVEAGKLEVMPENIPLGRMLEALKMAFAPLAEQKNLVFHVKIKEDAPQTLFTDRQRVEQILRNLMSNAIKFTEQGDITLTVSPHGPDGGAIRFDVQDSGIGIPLHQQERIFEAFQQADGTTSRRFGGTGLGLSISRDLSRLLGGAIEVSSSPGKGSIFSLLLPVELGKTLQAAPANVAAVASAAAAAAGLGQPLAASAPTPTAALAVSASPAQSLPDACDPAFADDRDLATVGRSVLVIEDDVEFAKILYDLAHEMHYRCIVTHSAAGGLTLAAGYLPDAILLDLRLPDGSGLDVLQRLKQNPSTRHIPVHVVSALEPSEAALHLGAVGHAIKPTTLEDLKNVFLKLEDKFTQKVKRVLLVEDDVRQRESVIELISDTDVEITAVALGEEALALLRTSIFDCMIIDLKLPDIQGDELLERMSRENIVSFPPVIVYTGRNLTRAEEHDLLKYSRTIIIKGARSPERLLDEVTLFLHKVESELSAERQGMLRKVRSRDRVFEGRKVLLVDDDVRNIFALTNALEQKGLSVEIGRNGFEAISQLDAIADIDLVLMDVMMPGMNGLEAMDKIRQDARFRKLPIIAITAKAMKDDQEQCIKAGASDYLAKPIDLDRLYSLLRVWMPKLDRL
jgi:signal transduction histidine kinase/CheY-like chemotaxis protein/CHASE3 domain sensor protein